jgi:ADP-heptose:LPS heptosyltransferase
LFIEKGIILGICMRMLNSLSSSIYYNLVKIVFAKNKRRKIGASACNRVVIVKFDGLGDFVLFLSAAKEIKKIYSGKQVVLFCSEMAAEVARLTGIFDYIEVFHKRDLRVSNLKKTALRFDAFDCEIMLNVAVSRSVQSEMVAALVHAKKKISVDFEMSLNGRKINGLRKYYDEIIPIDKKAMSLEQNASIVRFLGKSDFMPAVYYMNLANADTLPLPNDYFVLLLGASAPWKQYPVERFKMVAKKICEDTGFACALAGDDRDCIDVGNFFKDFGFTGYSYVGKTNVGQLIELISRAKFVIGNDTAAIHIASMCKVKSLCVAASTSADRFYPYIVGDVKPIAVRHFPLCRGCSFDIKTNLKCIGGAQNSVGLPTCFSQITTEEILQNLQFLY